MIKEKRRKKKKIDWPFFIGFLFGLLLLLYPYISEWVNGYQYKILNRRFDRAVTQIPEKEKDERYELAKHYNDSLINPNIEDPYKRDKQKEGRKEYAKMLEVKEMLGYIDIPKFGQKIPIYAGTSDEVLNKGVGHMELTSLPTGGKGNHTVLTAHSGMSKVKLFSNLRKMKRGDIFMIYNLKEKLAYKVVDINEIKPNDFSSLKRYPGKDYCTLLTCSPYLVNTHRLLVKGERVDYKAVEGKRKKDSAKHIAKIVAALTLIAAIILFVKKKLEIK